MSTVHAAGVNRQRAAGISSDVGEIIHVSQPDPIVNVSRAQLRPREEAASLLPLNAAPPGPIAPLTRLLGPEYTVANPAWTDHAVRYMRALEKRLVEHSLTLPQEERGACMEAISVVELNVQWRLRLQQMREFELVVGPESVKPE